MCQSQQDSDHRGVEVKKGNIGEGKGEKEQEEQSSREESKDVGELIDEVCPPWGHP